MIALYVIVGLVAAIVVYDVVQRRHSILRNFPLIGHLRYIIEWFGPELRQYIVTSNEDERPFNRNERRWIYATSERANNYFGFGTDMNFDTVRSHVIVKPNAFPLDARTLSLEPPVAKVLGGPRKRRLAVRPPSIVNISGMSYGALSGPAVKALNEGAKLARCWQNTGEGGLAMEHRSGGDLIFQVGTGYFSCRNADGRFDLSRLVDLCASNPVRAIEVKLSQGAKPGHGGILPAAKVTPAIAAIRGVPVGVDCVSPGVHTAFSTTRGMVDFVETIAEATGLPVGIKCAVGDTTMLDELASSMAAHAAGVDFITIDGGEGGTGAAPLAFADHVALPFRAAFANAYGAFARAGIADDVVFIASGKVGLPANALLAFAMGADIINVGREALLSIGCVQAQRCHTGYCPSGVATQSKWLSRGLDPTLKSVRCANFIRGLRKELVELSAVCRKPHPALVTLDAIDILDAESLRSARTVFGYDQEWGRLSARLESELVALLDDASPRATQRGTGDLAS